MTAVADPGRVQPGVGHEATVPIVPLVLTVPVLPLALRFRPAPAPGGVGLDADVAWKVGVQDLADAIGVPITACHPPSRNQQAPSRASRRSDREMWQPAVTTAT
jgi:hypothetical protein